MSVALTANDRSRRQPLRQRVAIFPRGVRLMHGRDVVSIALARPGPSHSLFDVMAGCVTASARGRRLALLGFGCGAVLAPLRAMGWLHSIDAVDIDATGYRLLRRVAGGWIEPLRFSRSDASLWLAHWRRSFDVVVIDLSVSEAGDLVMPAACINAILALLPRRLGRRGVTVFNLFSPGTQGWMRLIESLRLPGQDARLVIPKDFDHRILLQGRSLPPPHALGRLIRARLQSIRSRQRARILIRACS